MAYDIPSISDLEAIQLLNKHYAEVITSKEGGVSSAADITQTTNPITGVTRRTLYKILDDAQAEHDAQITAHEVEHDNQIAAHEIEHDAQITAHEVEHDNQMQSFENDFDSRLAGMAFTRVGTFTAGATLTDMRQTLLWEVSQGGDGHEYGWTGSFLPSGKVVAAGSTPATSGGVGAGAWVDRSGDASSDVEERLLGVGAKIYRGSNGLYVQNGDTVPAETTHLRVLLNGKPENVLMSPVASGLVTNLTETDATIGGAIVDFINAVNGYKGEWYAGAPIEMGSIYGYQGSEWRSLTGASGVAPVEGNDWRSISRDDKVYAKDYAIDGICNSASIQAAIDAARPNQTVVISPVNNGVIVLDEIVVVTKPLILKWGGNSRQFNNVTLAFIKLYGSAWAENNPALDYGLTAQIHVRDGGVGFLCGMRTGLVEGAPSVPYDSGKVVFDGLTIRPVTPRSAGTVAIQINQDHNYEIKNCLFRYLDVANDVTGAYGVDIHHNFFVGNRLDVMVDPDYYNGFGNPLSTLAGWETNDINVTYNTMAGPTEAHLKIHGFGHKCSFKFNSVEKANIGAHVGGYSGDKQEITSRAWYGFNESDNYYESTKIPVLLGHGGTGFVYDADVGGSYVNVGPSPYYPYLVVKRCNGLRFKSGSYMGLPSGFTAYNEVVFDETVNSPVAGLVFMDMMYRFSGYPTVHANTDTEIQVIRQAMLKTNPLKLVIDPSHPNAVGRYDVNDVGGLLLSAWDAGKAAMPFKSLSDVKDWFERTPVGAFFESKSKTLQIEVNTNSDLGILRDCHKISHIEITSLDDFYGRIAIDNCSKTVITAKLAHSSGDLYGKHSIKRTDVIFNGSLKVDNDTGYGTAWFLIENGRFMAESPTVISGKMAHIVKANDGGIVFCPPSLNAGASTSVGIVNAGKAALIIKPL